MRTFPTLANDNSVSKQQVSQYLAPDDALDIVVEVLYTGRKLLEFTQSSVDSDIITMEEKKFLDEMLGSFTEFDGPNKETYSLMKIRTMTLQILIKFEARQEQLQCLLGKQDSKISGISVGDIYSAFKQTLQTDVAGYSLEEGMSTKNIENVTGKVGDLARTIIDERGGKRA